VKLLNIFGGVRALKTWSTAVLILSCTGVTVALLAWRCLHDPKINFFPRDGRAEWILFPAAIDARAHLIASLDTVFRCEFTLDKQPQEAKLNVRGAKRIELKINDIPVDLGPRRNWKDISAADVPALLQTGANTIEARVFNDNAPPSLWLALTTDQLTLRSDQSWEASLTGSAWRRAALAAAPRFPDAGSAIAGGETTSRALATVWPVWLAFAGISVLVWLAGRWWVGRLQPPTGDGCGGFSRGQVNVLLVIVAGLWIVLFWNNARLLPYRCGFDAQAHINYIKYVQERRALPLPTEGSEMFQPPLYYVLSAIALSLCGLSVTDGSAILVLRLLTMLFGIAHFTLVFLSLRLFFRCQTGLQLVGLLLAAFLPMQLYMAHYVTNETLAATLIAASIYLGLRWLQTDKPPVSQYVWLGFWTGAAMLTKATAILLLPALFVALASKLAVQQSPIAIRFRNLGLMLTVCFTVCGWHYLRIWRRFGTPLLGNWDVAAGFSWWQDLGYHTAADYARFGRSLVAPLFSSLNGFADGIYSTFWGDGLCGGVPDLAYRPPWNYDLIAGGYLLAVLPTLLILVGAALTIGRFAYKPSARWLALLSLSGAVTLGVIFMTLKVASYAQVKAFYGLSMLVPLCCFGAIGWDVLTRGRKVLQFGLGTILLVWAINSFASVWIRPSPSQHLYLALRLRLEDQIDAAASEAAKAVNSDPSNASARRLLASVLDELGRPKEALEEAQRAAELSPMDNACHLQLGLVLARQGQTERAIEETRRALELGPENVSAYNLLVQLLESSGKEEVIMVARDALTVSPFSAELHYRLGLAAARKGDFVTATNQFGYALLLRPDWVEPHSKLLLALLSLGGDPDGRKHLREAASLAPDSPVLLDDFAWLLATHPDGALRNGGEAVRLAEHACALTGRKNPGFIATLAAAYAETGRFSEASHTAEEALSLARSSGDKHVVRLSQNLLASFRVDRPYREEPIHE
jgi:Flp pilus assembly protein TadD